MVFVYAPHGTRKWKETIKLTAVYLSGTLIYRIASLANYGLGSYANFFVERNTMIFDVLIKFARNLFVEVYTHLAVSLV